MTKPDISIGPDVPEKMQALVTAVEAAGNPERLGYEGRIAAGLWHLGWSIERRSDPSWEAWVQRRGAVKGQRVTGRDGGVEVDTIAWPDGTFTVAEVRLGDDGDGE